VASLSTGRSQRTTALNGAQDEKLNHDLRIANSLEYVASASEETKYDDGKAKWQSEKCEPRYYAPRT
jgi:hypothetical protein